MIPQMNPQVQMFVGVFLVVYGLLYFYKAVLALLMGKVVYWAGFLPLTVVSPWIVPGIIPSEEDRAKSAAKKEKKKRSFPTYDELQKQKNAPVKAEAKKKKEYDPKSGAKTLTRSTEGMWVHLVMAPLFFASSLLFLIAGSEFLGFPGCETVNDALNGGKAGRQFISFSKRIGFSFPVVAQNKKGLMKIGQGHLDAYTPLFQINKGAQDEIKQDEARDANNKQN